MVSVNQYMELVKTLQASGDLGPGRTFWVNGGTAQHKANGGSDNNQNDGLDPTRPFATIDYAVGRCTDGRGDNIMVLPTHTETVDAAGDITLDVIGVTIWGLGRGDDRPTITFSTAATADIEVDAANCRIHNFRFLANIDELAGAIDVDAAYFTLSNCEFRMTDATDGTSVQTIAAVIADANADGLTVDNCVFWGLGTAAASGGDSAAVEFAGATDVTVSNCYMHGAFTVDEGPVFNSAAAARVKIVNNVLVNNTANATKALVLHASTTGIVDNNRMQILSGTAPWTAAGANMGWNWYAAAVGTAMTVI